MFYFHPIGEIVWDHSDKSECECIQKFLHNMIKIFSQYGENWGDIKLNDLMYDFHCVNLKSDRKYLQVEYDENNCHCPMCKNHLEVVHYGTSGELRLGFAALLIPENANIKYVRNLIVEKKLEDNDNTIDDQQSTPIISDKVSTIIPTFNIKSTQILPFT